MKRLLSALVVALSLYANAAVAWEKIGGLQVADTTGLTSAVIKLGEMSGNSMAAAMLAAKIMDLPSNGFFGPMRQGSSLYFPLYVDPDRLAEANDAEDFGNAVEYAMVYPTSLPKDEFLAKHPGAVETNGMMIVDGEMFSSEDEWDEDSRTYVAFSEDGMWAAASDRPEQVVLALGDVMLASRPMDGDIVRAEISPRGVSSFCKVLEGRPKAVELVSGVDGISVAMRIDDAGVDIHGFVRTVEGSLVSKFGEVRLPEDPFEFDNGESVLVLANSFNDQPGIADELGRIVSVCKEGGLDIEPFVACTGDEDVCRIVLDLPAAIGHFASPTNSLEGVDLDKIEDAFDDEPGAFGFEPATRARYVSLAFAGYRPQYSASKRFASILPEAKDKPLCYAGTYSICTTIQAGLDAALAALDDRRRGEMAPLAALFPKECEGGVATAYWRDGDSIMFMTRISADEIRRVVTGASAVFMYGMMRERDRRYRAIEEGHGEDCFSGAADDDDCEDDFDDEDED